MTNEIFETLIIGCGPAGIRAALEIKNANKKVAIIEKNIPGGKVNVAPRVDNYPGFKKIPGPDLAFELYKRIKNNGVQIINDEVIKLEKSNDLFVFTCKNGTFFAKTALIASGTSEAKIGLEKEEKLLGHGISYCSICDGHFFKQKDVLVIGGGNAALKEAIHLSSLVKTLYLIHRRNQFRGDKKLVDELSSFANVKILTPYIPLKILGEEKVEGMVIQNVETKQEETLKIDGLFPLVGQIPNSKFLSISNVKDEWGTIPVNKNFETVIEGLYAAGDILPRSIRQIYLAEHDGMIAAKNIIERLNKNNG